MPRGSFYVLSGLGTIALATLAGLNLGPGIEARVWPIRVNQAVENIHRDAHMVRFTWTSTKLRVSPLEGLTVFLFTSADRFVVPLYRDLSLPDEPCTDVTPIAQSKSVGIGAHSLQYCVEIPAAVQPADWFKISIVAHYRGLWGLWDLPQVSPDIDVPAELVPTSGSPKPADMLGG